MSTEHSKTSQCTIRLFERSTIVQIPLCFLPQGHKSCQDRLVCASKMGSGLMLSFRRTQSNTTESLEISSRLFSQLSTQLSTCIIERTEAGCVESVQQPTSPQQQRNSAVNKVTCLNNAQTRRTTHQIQVSEPQQRPDPRAHTRQTRPL